MRNIIPGLLAVTLTVSGEDGGLTGNWGGVRDTFAERGVEFSAIYIGEVLGNLSGGVDRGAVYEGLLELGLDVDFERAGLWRNGHLHVSSLYPHGRSPTEELVGDLLAVSNMDAWESFRLYELWYEHAFMDKRLTLRLGQLAADSEFAYTEAGLLFLNATFGWPAFISANTRNTGPAYYVAAPGVRVRVEPSDGLFFQGGVYDGDSFDDVDGDPRVTQSGTRIHLGSEQGVFALGEAGSRVKMTENALPGEYKLGFWFHSGEFESNLDDPAGEPFVVTGREPRVHGENFGFYTTGEQMLWREQEETSEGLWVFSKIGFSPEDRNLFSLVYDGGFAYQGLIPGRGMDVAGIGVVYAKISDEVRERERVERELNGGTGVISDHELVLEVSYSVQVNEWLTIQPDFQWVHHPGGSSAIPDAFLIGLRTSIVF